MKNEHKKKSYPKIILLYYEKAVEVGDKYFDLTELKKAITELREK